MPIEVIDLLSSPEPATAPPNTTRTRPRSRPESPKFPARRLLGSSLDSGADVPARSRDLTPPTKKPIADTNLELWYLSDDPDDEESVGRKRSAAGVNLTSKRLRRSSSLQTGPQAKLRNGSPDPQRSRPPQPAGSNESNPTVETIDLSSSPEIRDNRSKISTGVSDSENLFVSPLPKTQLLQTRTMSFDDIDDIDDIDYLSVSPPRRNHQRDRENSGARSGGKDANEPACNPSPSKSLHQATWSLKSLAAWDCCIPSSAPERTVAADDDAFGRSSHGLQRSHSAIITIDDSDESGGRKEGTYQDASEEEFPDIADIKPPRFSPLRRKNPHASKPKGPKTARPHGLKRPAEPKKSAEERSLDKEQKAAAREAERERKTMEKERLRAEKALEKEKAAALAEVNKVRTDKKVATPEMIVDFPDDFDHATQLQAETLLKDLKVQCESWSSPVKNVIRWRRKVDKRYDDHLGRWEPVPLRIEPETYAMVILTAAEFVTLALDDDAGLESHVQRLQRHFKKHTIIYMIEGLALWMRRNRNIRNRQFVSAVRSGLEPSDPMSSQQQEQQQQQQGQSRRRNQRNGAGVAQHREYIDEDTVEDALLQLQVLHGVLIHHTAVALETAQWIAVFTQHISTAPYRQQRDAFNDAAAGFCMASGQVRTGDGPHDTYVRMLQMITRVTAPVAYGVTAEFATVSELVRGLEAGGPLCLQDVRKSANRDGALADRAIGPSISRRLHKIFLGRDETSMDV